jgi:hypothetical protein
VKRSKADEPIRVRIVGTPEQKRAAQRRLVEIVARWQQREKEQAVNSGS